MNEKVPKKRNLASLVSGTAFRGFSMQFGSMPVLEEAKTMVYVANHNMITMAMTYKMADKGEEKNEYWPKFSFILVLSSLLFVFLLLWIGKYLEDRE